jgi:hypothetical protein
MGEESEMSDQEIDGTCDHIAHSLFFGEMSLKNFADRIRHPRKIRCGGIQAFSLRRKLLF